MNRSCTRWKTYAGLLVLTMGCVVAVAENPRSGKMLSCAQPVAMVPALPLLPATTAIQAESAVPLPLALAIPEPPAPMIPPPTPMIAVPVPTLSPPVPDLPVPTVVLPSPQLTPIPQGIPKEKLIVPQFPEVVAMQSPAPVQAAPPSVPVPINEIKPSVPLPVPVLPLDLKIEPKSVDRLNALPVAQVPDMARPPVTAIPVARSSEKVPSPMATSGPTIPQPMMILDPVPSTPTPTPTQRVTAVPTPAEPERPAATSLSENGAIRVVARLGLEKPRCEILRNDDVLLKIVSEQLEIRTAGTEPGKRLAPVKASGRVQFTAPGCHGTCDELVVNPADGSVKMTGNVRIQCQRGKGESEIAADQVQFKLGTAPAYNVGEPGNK
ncbi:MAG: hypothetical protein ACRCZF_24510 [Gemmataceae bacterium]